MAKDIVYYNSAGVAFASIPAVDFAEFVPNFFIYLYNSPELRNAITWGDPAVSKITVSPVGVPYPGDGAWGTGPKQVSIGFKAGIIPASTIMNRVDFVDFSSGWFVITKGLHIIGWSPNVVNAVIIQPTE